MVSLALLVGSGKLGSGCGVGLEKLGSHVIWIDLDSCLVPGELKKVNANEGQVNIFTLHLQILFCCCFLSLIRYKSWEGLLAESSNLGGTHLDRNQELCSWPPSFPKKEKSGCFEVNINHELICINCVYLIRVFHQNLGQVGLLETEFDEKNRPQGS